MDGAALEQLVCKADLCGIARLGIDDEHGSGSIDAAVDHFFYIIMQDGTFRVGAFIVPYLTVTESGIPQAVKNIIHTGIREYHCRLVGLHGRNDIFIFLCNIDHLDMLKIHGRVL